MLKAVAVILLILFLMSLFSGLPSLFNAGPAPESRRTLYALAIRITLAVALLGVVYYVLAAGDFTLTEP